MPLAETGVLTRVAADAPPDPTSGLPADRFHPLPHVVSARAGDTTVLMDRKRGSYHTLNEVSGRIWELLGGSVAVPQIMERLLKEYDVPRERLQADAITTVWRFLSEQLVAPGAMSISTPPNKSVQRQEVRTFTTSSDLRVPSVLRCGLTIFWMKVLLRTRGFLGTLGWLRRHLELIPEAAADLEVVRAVEHAVAVAGALYPGRALCLEQSLVLYFLLRRRGVAVKYCQGVQAHPLAAHSWVEYRGEPINDVGEHVKHFTQLPEQLP